MALPINIEDLINKRKIEGRGLRWKKVDGCGNKPATEKTTITTTKKSSIGSEKKAVGPEKTTEKIVRLMKDNPHSETASRSPNSKTDFDQMTMTGFDPRKVQLYPRKITVTTVVTITREF